MQATSEWHHNEATGLASCPKSWPVEKFPNSLCHSVTPDFAANSWAADDRAADNPTANPAFEGQPVVVQAHPPVSSDLMLATQFPLRILVAEDNLVNQKVMLRLLQRFGYEADLAMTGLEVLTAVRQQAVIARPYDLILLDVQMPEMDGLTATRQICQLYPRQQRPWIVAVTASVMQSDREICQQAGMDDYLSKPLRLDDLQAALKRCGERRCGAG